MNDKQKTNKKILGGSGGYETYLRFARILAELDKIPQTVSELCKATNCKQSTCYRIIKELESKGVIKIISYDTNIGRRGALFGLG